MPEKHTFSMPTLTGPGAFYVTGEDNLRVVLHNSLASAVVTIEGRFLSLDGAVLPFVQTYAPTSDRVAFTRDFRLGEGWILNVSARVTTGAPSVGQVYARICVIRGLGAAPIQIGTLVQGYATDGDDLAWPGGPLRTSVEGPGWLRTLANQDPAEGEQVLITVPTGARWRPLALRMVFTSNGTAANREVALRITDGTNEIANVPAGVTQVASQVRRYSYFHSAPRGAGTISLYVIAPLPRIDIPAGYTIETLVDNIQISDAFSGVNLEVEEWIEA